MKSEFVSAPLRVRFLPFLALVVLGWTVGHARSQGVVREIALREPLGLDWKAETLAVPFEALPDACHRDSLQLTGPDGPLPAQWIDVELWPGTEFVRRATLVYVTDLGALETRLLTLSCGPDPVPPTTSDLSLSVMEDGVELANERFGLRLLHGVQAYDPPVDAQNVPGPVRGVRLADGTWVGDSRMFGPVKIRSHAARVVEQGPALVRVKIVYEYEDGRVMRLSAQLSARAPRAEWDMRVTPHDPDAAAQFVLGSGWDEAEAEAGETVARDGWRWRIDSGFENIALAVQLNPNPERNRWGTPVFGPRGRGGRFNYQGLDLTPEVVDLAAEPEGELAGFMPWAAFHQTRQSVLTFTRSDDVEARAEQLQFAVLNPGAWVEPAPPGTWAPYMNVRTRHKSVPLVRGSDGDISLIFNAASGDRQWQVGIPASRTPEERWMEGYFIHGAARRIGTRQATWSLNRILGLDLEWPDTDSRPPLHAAVVRDVDTDALANHLQRGMGWAFSNLSYRDRHAIDAYQMSGRDVGVAQALRLTDRLEYFLGAFGNLDRWRYGTRTILPELYDEVMRSGLASPEQRRLFRARLALLGYVMADPGDWSPERGWASGNLNMTIYNVQTLSHIASRIPDHPMAAEWSAPATVWVDRMLEQHVGEHGEFVGAGESLTHYAWGSAGAILANARFARAAGGTDYIHDPRMKKMIEFLAKIVTPPDPRPHRFHAVPRSVTPPVGRGTVYNVPRLFDALALEIADRDPELAQDLWWAWQRANPGERAGHPYRTPSWGSEFFPRTGVILRHGLDTAYEHYAFFLLENDRVAYASEQGALAAIWALGVPIATRFGGRGYEEREEILASRVLPAWNPGDRDQRFPRFQHEGPRQIRQVSLMPRQDYVEAELHMRTANSIHHGGVQSALPTWPVMETEAALPIHWQRQILFVKGPAPADACYYVFRDTISGDQPTRWQFWTLSEKIGTAAAVENLNAFRVDTPGDQNVDALELEGDRFTAVGQYGVDLEYFVAAPADTVRHTLRWGLEHGHYTEYQDLLHLQMPGDGAYFVALFPRPRQGPPPAFSVRGDGHVIRVEGDHGTDHVFLAAREVEAVADGIRFTGTAASVQSRRSAGRVLCLGAPGEIGLPDGVHLQCDAPVTVQLGSIVTVVSPISPPLARLVTLRVPGTLHLINPPPDVRLDAGDDAFRLTVPAGVALVMLRLEP